MRWNMFGRTFLLAVGLMGRFEALGPVAVNGAVGFSLSWVNTRVITPNGDGLNDFVLFELDNPKDSAVFGKVFDLWGSFVSDMIQRDIGGNQYMEWDGKAGGRVVAGGVYMYQIQAEEKAWTGTLVVIR